MYTFATQLQKEKHLKKSILTLSLFSLLYGHDYHNTYPNIMLKSSLTYKEFTNSKQKEDGIDTNLIIDAKMDAHRLELAYTTSNVNTLQPPLPNDLEVRKSFVRYSYMLNQEHTLGLSYMYISDNIAPTDEGSIYALHYLYSGWDNLRLSLAHYYSNYNDFSVNQSDIELQYHTKIDYGTLDFTLMAKYIALDDYTNAIFNPNNTSGAQDDYTTVGFKVHGGYRGFHGGFGAWFGKRMFAVMNDGYAVQHHAMEFDQSYFMGVGKKFNDLNVMLKYSHQEATELPQNNPNVEANSYTLMLTYKF